MHNRVLLILGLLFFAGQILGEEHELIYNNDHVYYDECRVTVSPRNYLQPPRAYVQIQRPCNGTLLWTHPNLQLTLTMVNLENDPFTLCFEKKSLDKKLIQGVKQLNEQTNQTTTMREINTNSGTVLCATSTNSRLAVVIDAEPAYGGIYLPYAMYNQRHPWTSGPYPGWERSGKYLFGPTGSVPLKQKKIRRNRKKFA